VEALEKPKLLWFFWISCIGFLAGFCFIGIESHLNTINSWSFIVASVVLLLPFTQKYNTSLSANFFIGLSPILAFPCILFSPWILLRLVFSRNLHIRYQSLVFFLSCAIQFSLPRILPSHWSFADDRCLQMRDIFSIIPSLVIKNILPLFGFAQGFERHQQTILLSYNSLIIISAAFFSPVLF